MHYSLAQKPKELLEWSTNMAKDIQAKQAAGKISHPVLVYRGMSGISAATALSLALYRLNVAHDMFYVRKEHEQSHGDKFHHSCGCRLNDDFTYIFVDDFIAGGDTKRECRNMVNKEWDDIEFSYCALQRRCSGVDMFTKLKPGNYMG